ncbi:MAG: hypothetical protein IPL61_35805 [Myxococcales bacterium]|nr:hypothetical protein [Myxococcales bacterium]
MMMRIALVVLATLATVTSVAAAQPSTTMSSTQGFEERTETVKVVDRYGLEVLAMDAAGLAIMVAGGAADNETAGWLGAGVVMLGPAAMHLRHGDPGRAAGSVALRAGLIVGGAALGAAMATCGPEEWFCGLGETMIGGLVGYGAAVVIDAGFIAQTTRTERRPRWTPQVAASSSGLRVGVGGVF